MKSLIGGTGRHVDRTEEKGSSTNKKSENHAVPFNDREKREASQKQEKVGERTREREGGERREVDVGIRKESVGGKKRRCLY